MPSHIFVHLGLWDDVVVLQRGGLDRVEGLGEAEGTANDELDLHAAAWLHYGYLQQGRYARAKALSDSIGALFASGAASPHQVSDYLTMMSCQNVVESRRPDSTPGVAAEALGAGPAGRVGRDAEGGQRPRGRRRRRLPPQGRHHREPPRPYAARSPGLRAQAHRDGGADRREELRKQ